MPYPNTKTWPLGAGTEESRTIMARRAALFRTPCPIALPSAALNKYPPNPSFTLIPHGLVVNDNLCPRAESSPGSFCDRGLKPPSSGKI